MQSDSRLVEDFISGKLVRNTPEEVDAVQVFARLLVEDYEYPKAHIQTHPQWRVKVRPPDLRKEYPVDIAVFVDEERSVEKELIIVECKKRSRKDGRSQLEDYLRFSSAQIGVWFNGDESLFVKKRETDGKALFEEIPSIPKYGERLADIGRYRRSDLKPAHNLKAVFRSIRNYLAANAVGITRDEVFAQQMINLVFCKIYDERFTKADAKVKFRVGVDEPGEDVRARLEELFERVKRQYSDVIGLNDELLLDDASLMHAVGAMQLYCLVDSERDAIADAFETFIGPSLKGGQGQFFTPRNVVKLLVDLTAPTPTDKIIDPACGSGGFLVDALRHVWRQVQLSGEELDWPESEIFSEQQKVAIRNFRGVDKDAFLSRVAKAYMAIIGDGRAGVYCENSLEKPERWSSHAQDGVPFGQFDVVITNPPFGKKLKLDDQGVLAGYRLAHRWRWDKDTQKFEETSKLRDGQSPQILFIERCLSLLKPGGRIGIILPESMLCNPNHRYIIRYIQSVAAIRAVISLPEELFQPYTHAKTCAVLLQKEDGLKTQNSGRTFMAVARWCGHDSRGHGIPHDDVPAIQSKYNEYRDLGRLEYDHLGFTVESNEIVDDIYLPKYYNPEVRRKLSTIGTTHNPTRLGDLVEDGIVELSTGNEVGKLAYGTGDVPFIRTSDIANWEIKIDPKHGLSESLYAYYREKQDVQENDILMVRDGTYLVGTCALVTSLDTRIVYQSHIYKIRSTAPEEVHPYLLLATLSSPLVKEQIFAKRFTQDIIDTLGRRIEELVLPFPRSASKRQRIIEDVGTVIGNRVAARQLAWRTVLSVVPGDDAGGDEFAFLTIGR
ncbi:MAG: N-6 DNA methylase [Gammaproteobacteria bacterium]|nr:N-6 DNA methylase [Gammaproteobacteria bacterium]